MRPDGTLAAAGDPRREAMESSSTAERIVVRRAKPGDAGALVEARRGRRLRARGLADLGRPWRTPGEERRFLRALRRYDDAAVFVAELPTDGIVGRLSLGRDPHPASRHVADLGLMVSALHRRRGIGTALLREAEEWARAVGVRKLELHVFPHNDAAIQLYESRGFRRGRPTARPLPPRRRVPRRGADGARRPLDSAGGFARPDRGQLLQAAGSRPRPVRAGQPSRKSSENSASSAWSSWRRTRGRSGPSRGDRGPGGGRARAEPLSRRGRLPARTALAERHGVRFEEVALGAGADGVVDALAQISVEPGDEIVCGWPSFPSYVIAATKLGGVARTIPLATDATTSTRCWTRSPIARLVFVITRTIRLGR